MLRPGHVIDGKYRLDQRIGEGGMGVVFRATDLRLAREVAIKVLQPGAMHDLERAEGMLREAQSMATLRHPNVVEIYDVGRLGAFPFLVMPFHRGADLADWAELHGGPPLPSDVVVGVLGQVCSGLEAMHRRGLVHGDIKPSNVLVSDAFEAAITDLGLARRAADGEPDRIAPGTPGFVAPELIELDPYEIDQAAKADVYSLGVTAYWLLTGVMPFGDGQDEVFEHWTRAEADRAALPSTVRPELHPAFDAPVMRALERSPRARPDVAQLRRELFEARERSHRRGAPERPFVVVVDDDRPVLQALERVIRASVAECEVVAVTDPQAALSIIEARPPALVVTDLEMPGLNGVEFVAALRGLSATRSVPVVVVSGVGGASDWKLLEKLGVHRFLLKPVPPDVLRHVVRRVLVPGLVDAID